MKAIFFSYNRTMKPFIYTYQRARAISRRALIVFLLLTCLVIPLFGCVNTVDYSDCVSELRDNVFLAEQDGFSLRIYAVKKETPYITDGIPQESTSRLEAYLQAPNGAETCLISFSVHGKTYQDEMSFDNVKCEYYYSRSMDVSTLSEIKCELKHGETTVQLTAKSVRDKNTLSPTQVLNQLREKESELFEKMTDKYGFAGEIYLRLLYEDAPYYYVGVIERNATVHAFLINAQTGKIIAKRESK